MKEEEYQLEPKQILTNCLKRKLQNLNKHSFSVIMTVKI